jgi:hypothetical protein
MVSTSTRSTLSVASSRSAGGSLPVIAVTGMAFEARIVRGEGVEVVYAARADLLERARPLPADARGSSVSARQVASRPICNPGL